MQPLDGRLSDWLIRQQAQDLKPDPDILIVDIDDHSLEKMKDIAGAWPWPRSVHGEMVLGIAKQKPKAIVFDISFEQADAYRPESDRFFNEALEASDNIYFPMLRRPEAADTKDAPLASQIAELVGLVQTDKAILAFLRNMHNQTPYNN